MTPAEAVLMDDLMERGYTREQAARALVALTLPEPHPSELDGPRRSEHIRSMSHSAQLQAEAERRGYLPRASATTRKGRT